MAGKNKNKNDFPSVKKNFLYRLAYELLILITPFITTPYVSRVLGADGIGIYSYTSSIMTYFTLFAVLGTTYYGEREIAQHRDDKGEASKLFWEIELMTVITSSICIFLWIGVVIFSTEYRYYFLALLPLLFGSMADISWYYTGYEQIKYIVIRNFICKIAGILLLFVFVRTKNDLFIYILMNSAITLAGNLSMWTYLPRMLVKVDFCTLHFRRHFKETLIYFIPTIATSIYTVLDKTLIGIITEDSYQNGYYEQATKIVNIIKNVVFSSVNAVMGSRIAYLFAQEKYEEIRRRIQRSMDFILLLGYGAFFGLIGVADKFVPVFLGDGYGPVVSLLYAMAPLIIIIGVSNCLGSQYYSPSGQRIRSAKVIILGSVVNLCLNLVMIPWLGGIGAVAASVAAELVISVLYVNMSDGYMTVKMLWNCSFKRLIAGIMMCFVVILAGEFLRNLVIWRLVIQIVVGGCVYGAILIYMKDGMLLELIRMVWNAVLNKKK